MRPIIRLLVATLVVAGLTATAQEPDTVQMPRSFEKTISRKVSLDYLLFLPKDYDARAAKKWPTILFLHGAGERGTNVWKVSIHGPPKVVKSQPDFGFIVISPQCPSGRTWENEPLLALLDDVIAKHNVDTNRIYLTGLSMGGYGTWNLGLSHPDRFAAIAPICGGGDRVAMLLASPARRNAVLKNPVWAFHGAKDTVVPLDESEKMITALKRAGHRNVELTVYPDASHDSWTATYINPKLYEWFLSHERK
jgi:predicted peptidase